MYATRRHFGALFSGGLVAAAGLIGAAPALARDADDGPANVFFSPHGRPFRAPQGAPYPVVDWFKGADRNGDGKLARDEFIADAEAFFAVLDLDGDGALNGREIAIYEHAIAPEILGLRVEVYAERGLVRRPGADGARLWLAQNVGTMQATPLDRPDRENSLPGPAEILPGDIRPHDPGPTLQDGLGTGAAPYSFFRSPEPVTAADPDYVFRGVVRKAKFVERAQANFAALDMAGTGFLTLAGLPRSPVQSQLEGGGRRQTRR
jgi:hypothetical protein